MSDIYSNIRKFRKEKNMTLESLALKINTSKQTIQRYESGEIKQIPYDKIIALSTALDVPPQILMGWTEIPNISQELEELFDLYTQANVDQRKAVINLLRSFIL